MADKFDPTGMTPVMGVGSQGEGEAGSQPQEGWMKRVGDKVYYYDLNGNFTSGFRDAGNGWTAPISASGKDTALAKNTSHDNSFGALVSDVVSDPTFQQGLAMIGSMYGGPAVGSLISGASRAGQDGDLKAGLTQGLKSYALGKGMEYLTSPGVDELAGPPENASIGADPANPMQGDHAPLVDRAAYGYDQTPLTTQYTPTPGSPVPSTVSGGTPTPTSSLSVQDVNNALNTLKNPGSTALDYIAKNSGIDPEILKLGTTLGLTKPLTDLAGKVDKTVQNIVKPTDTKAPTPSGKDNTGSKDSTSGQTPYGMNPMLLALIAGQLGNQQQQQPVQTPTVDLKSVGEFDPFGEFNYGSKKTANAAQGGSISDLIRMLRS